MKVAILAAIDLKGHEPVGGILGFVESIAPYTEQDTIVFGYSTAKEDVLQFVEYSRKVRSKPLFQYMFQTSRLPLRMVATIFYLLRFKHIRREDIDLFYVHSAEFVLPLIVHGIAPERIVLHLHGAGNPMALARFVWARNRMFEAAWDAMYRFVFRRCGKIITIDDDCIELLKKYDVKSKGVPIPNAVDTNRFQFNEYERTKVRKMLGIPDLASVLMYAGRLEKFKNVDAFLLALQKLRLHTEANWYGLIVGSGSQEERLRKVATETSLRDFVMWLGKTPISELPGLYSAADAFLLPSLNEGVPLVLLEALSCGLPCVAYDVGGVGAVIKSDENGVLLKPDSLADTHVSEAVVSAFRLGQEKGRTRIAHSVHSYAASHVAKKLSELFSSSLQ